MVSQLNFILTNRSRTPENGQGLVEYALIILLVALVVIGAMRLFGIQLSVTFNDIVNQIP